MTGRKKAWIALGAAAVVIAVGIAVPALLFDPVRGFPVPEVTAEDLERQTEVVRAAAAQLREGDPRPGETLTLRQTPAQVRAILRITLKQYAFRDGLTSLPLRIDYRDDGRWSFVYIHDTGRRRLFGGGLRIDMTGRLSICGGVVSFAADSLKIGAVRLPRAAARRFGDAAMESLNEDETVADLAAAIRSLSSDESGELTVVVEPEELFWLMMK